ncbi:hypothetical protein V6N11_059759 [Hibiscus sabdariffa]|uniref:Uncharacterized protein n=2 Tax=Hibiscus sabdariffa TaxID=183260 RepID=A0ABR2NY09_9ROSI
MLFHAETGSLNGTLVGEENAVALPVPSSSQEQAAEALRAGLHSESDKDSTGSEKQEGSEISAGPLQIYLNLWPAKPVELWFSMLLQCRPFKFLIENERSAMYNKNGTELRAKEEKQHLKATFSGNKCK